MVEGVATRGIRYAAQKKAFCRTEPAEPVFVLSPGTDVLGLDAAVRRIVVRRGVAAGGVGPDAEVVAVLRAELDVVVDVLPPRLPGVEVGHGDPTALDEGARVGPAARVVDGEEVEAEETGARRDEAVVVLLAEVRRRGVGLDPVEAVYSE